MAEQLGRYILERRLAAGGMAEVFLAKQAGPGGFSKQCVLKRMLPPLAADVHFVRMFLDEARLAAQLNHPNIAQIFDFGEAGGTYYLAMEYVPGTNLRAIVKDHAKRKAFIPFHLVARIASHAAIALDYAHRAVGVDGQRLEIIHRDVSPQNIMLGTTGVVKLIDFGVAKAATATQRTAAGMIKGKFAYMSPEQIRGQPLDPRSDIFGLGLVLYELLASGRAVKGETEIELMKAAMRMQFDPIEERRTDVPAELRSIVERSLQKDREARYPSAAAMSADLEAYLTREGRNVTGPELACLLGGLAPIKPPSEAEDSTPGSDSSKHMPLAVQPSGSGSLPTALPFWETAPGAPTTIDPDLAEPAKPLGEAEAWQVAPAARSVPPGLRPRGQPPPPPVDAALSRVETDLRPAVRRLPAPPPLVEHTVLAAESSASLVRKAVRRSKVPWVVSGAVLLAGLAMVGFVIFLHPAPDPRPVPPVTPTPPVPPTALVTPTPPAAPALATPPAVPPPAVVAVAGVQHPAPTVPPVPVVPVVPVAIVPVEVARPKIAAPVESATLFVSSTPPMRVWIDDQPWGTTPLQAAVSSGDHTLMLKDEALGLAHRRTVRLARGEERREEWLAAKGRVAIRAVPYAEVFLENKSLGLTPIAPVEVWEGHHAFRFLNPDNGRIESRDVVVEPGQETLVKVDLRAR